MSVPIISVRHMSLATLRDARKVAEFVAQERRQRPDTARFHPSMTVQVGRVHRELLRGFLAQLDRQIFAPFFAAKVDVVPPVTLRVVDGADQAWFRVPFTVPIYVHDHPQSGDYLALSADYKIGKVWAGAMKNLRPRFDDIRQLPPELTVREAAAVAMVLAGCEMKQAVRACGRASSLCKGNPYSHLEFTAGWGSSPTLFIKSLKTQAPEIVGKFPAMHPLRNRVAEGFGLGCSQRVSAAVALHDAPAPVAHPDAELSRYLPVAVRNNFLQNVASLPQKEERRHSAWKFLQCIVQNPKVFTANPVVRDDLLHLFRTFVASLHDDQAIGIVDWQSYPATLNNLLEAVVCAQPSGAQVVADAASYRQTTNAYRKSLLQWLVTHA